MLIQAGASPRGIRASAYIADHIFARWPSKEGKAAHRAALDKALVANGRDPEKVGVLWGVGLIVGETESRGECAARATLTMIPPQAVGPYLSHNAGYDFSTLAGKLLTRGAERENNRQERFARRLRVQARADGWRARARLRAKISSNSDCGPRPITIAPMRARAAQLADMLEEEFEAGGSRGGFMIIHPQAVPRELA